MTQGSNKKKETVFTWLLIAWSTLGIIGAVLYLHFSPDLADWIPALVLLTWTVIFVAIFVKVVRLQPLTD